MYIHIIHTYISILVVHPLLSPFLFTRSLMKFPSFSFSFTLRRFIVSNYYYYCLTNVRIERERQSDVFIWWGVFLCWIFYVPLRRCYLLRSALCIRFEHCVHTNSPYSPTYSDIEKYCYRTYLFFVKEQNAFENVQLNTSYSSNAGVYVHQSMDVSAGYLFNNYFDSSIRTRNRTWPPGLRVQNAYNGFYSFYIFAWKKSYDFSHYCCCIQCPRAQYTWTSLSTDIYISLYWLYLWKVRLIIHTYKDEELLSYILWVEFKKSG